MDISEELARELARHATPVERIPRLRVVLAQVFAAASVTAALFLFFRGITVQFLNAPGMMWVFAALVASMTLVGGGASVAALAMSVPGRRTAARTGLVTAGIGVLLAAGAVTALLLNGPGARQAAVLSMDLTCLLSACMVGVPPAILALWFVSQAVPRRPALAVWVASTGAVGIGALAAQAGCPYDGMRHLILGHALAPFLGGMLVALPLTWLVRALRRR